MNTIRLFIIIAGDLNAKSPLWGSPQTDGRGRLTEEMVTHSEFCVLNTGQPTRLNYNGGQSHLDVTLGSTSIAMACRCSVFNSCMGSDHTPIMMAVNEKPVRTEGTGLRWRVKEADWGVFGRECTSRMHGLAVEDGGIDTANQMVTDAIVEAACSAVPQTGNGRGKRRNKPLPYWNDEIKAAI